MSFVEKKLSFGAEKNEFLAKFYSVFEKNVFRTCDAPYFFVLRDIIVEIYEVFLLKINFATFGVAKNREKLS